jgi:putative transcriptional regulator
MAEHVSNKVQHHRTKSNVTQEGLAEAVGVSRQTIIAIEKGHYAPSVLLAMKIARHFGMTVEDIFTIRS